MMFAEIALFPQEASTTATAGGHAVPVSVHRLRGGDTPGGVVCWSSFPCAIAAGRARWATRPKRTASRGAGMVLDLDAAGIFVVMFVWGAKVYFGAYRPPDDAATIYVVGKQWMWKFQHPEGQREIDALHVPVGRPIRLLMTSEDVIHSLFIPDFRIHMDLLPERYTSVWFQATRPGMYHLFCSQYCGTNHAGMTGVVDRHGTGGLRAVAAAGGRRIDGPGRPKGVSQVPLRQLPQCR